MAHILPNFVDKVQQSWFLDNKSSELAVKCDHRLGIFVHTGRKLESVSIPDLTEQVITSVLDALQLALERKARQLESNT